MIEALEPGETYTLRWADARLTGTLKTLLPEVDPASRTVTAVLTLIGIWTEKGPGLIVPGFVPSTLHEVVEYLPNLVEWKISIGIWAMGLIIFTLGLKIAVAVFKDEIHVETEGGA